MSPLRMVLVAAIALCGVVVFEAARKRASIAHPLVALAGVTAGLYAYLASNLVVAWIALGIAGIGVTLPAVFFRRARRAAGRGDLASAARWGQGHAALRRDARSRWIARFWSAARDFHEGNPAPGTALEAALLQDDSSFARSLREAWLGVRRDWPALRNARADDIRARALCQLGEIDAGIETCGKVWRRGLGWPGVRRAREASLTIVAFAGRTGATEALTRLLRLPPQVAALWRTVAHFAAGESAAAHAAAHSITDAPPAIRRARDGYLENPPQPTTLGESALAVVARAEAEILAGERLRGTWPWRDVGTTLVLLAIATVFALQASRGGVTDPQTLQELGALETGPGVVFESWRLFTYGLLHHGWTHLLVNTIAIAALGPIVARLFGRLATPLIFIVTSVAAGLGNVLLDSKVGIVGASAGALGLLGAITVATALHRSLRATVTANTVGRLILILVVVQSAFDIATPQISFASHAFGALSGATLGALWLTLRKRA